jgi:hypothetical protein
MLVLAPCQIKNIKEYVGIENGITKVVYPVGVVKKLEEYGLIS